MSTDPAPQYHIESFTWTNLKADINTGLHANAAQMFLDEVVTPSLNSIARRFDELTASDDPGSDFEAGDMIALKWATTEAFALAIHSIWERQFRDYLVECARNLQKDQDYIMSLRIAPWPQLQQRFLELRGLPLAAFDSFDDLDLLQYLGNACRHGDGKSARALFGRCPSLWPSWPPAFITGFGEEELVGPPKPPLIEGLSVKPELLARMTDAIRWFWDDHSYIYTNSISGKHSNVERYLAHLRELRAARVLKRNRDDV